MTYIIAEAGVAHEGSENHLMSLFNIAKASGCEAFKMQLYKPGTIGKNRFLPECPIEFIPLAMEKCKEAGMDFICTPHDIWALERLEQQGCDLYKIGSGDWHLMDPILETGKPVIVSTGMKTWGQICKMELPDGSGLLQCTSEYPTEPENVNLSLIFPLAEQFPHCRIGISDHSVGIHIALAACALGAEIIEKHICLVRDSERQDSIGACDYSEFINLVRCAREIELAIEPKEKIPTKGELETAEWVARRVAH